MAELRIENVSRSFGAFVALEGIDLAISGSRRHAVIGPNGAGKTTLFNVIGGQLRPSTGRITLDGADITEMDAHGRAARGIGRTFQRNNLFLGVSLVENVRLAVQAMSPSARDIARPYTAHRHVIAKAEAIVEQLGLTEFAPLRAAQLSYGDQRRLEIAIALAGDPKILLVDEPTAGMSPAETAGMVALMQALPRDVALLVVEHDMDVVMTVTETVTVLQNGRRLAEGDWATVRADARVQEAYLGRKRGAGRHA